jgi:tripartite-type tricarboxylate transporter receptor subunit TctC
MGSRGQARVVAVSLAVLAWAGCAAPPRPLAPPGFDAGFLAGRTLTYIVAAHPGGYYDTYARLVAKHIEHYVPTTHVIVRNVTGASNLVGTNEIYAAAPDGLTIGTFTMGLIYPQIVGEPAVRFDLGRMSWIGNAASEARIFAVGGLSGVRSIDELRDPARPVSIVTGAVGSPGYYAARILSEALGLNLRVIPGFNDNEAELAMMRGDVTASITSFTSLQPLVERGLARMILRVGGRSAHGDGLAAAEDLVTSARGRTLLSLVALQGTLARVTAGPPGIPSDRLETLRRLYMIILDDQRFRSELEQLQLPLEPIEGAGVSRRVRDALDQPADVVEWLRAARP